MFWKAITVATVLIFAASEANGQNFDFERIREQLEYNLEVGEQFELNGRQFNLNRVGRGKLGSKVLSGDNSDNEYMIISEDDDGHFHGSVLMDGKRFQILPNGDLRRAGRVKQNDIVIRDTYPDDRPMAYDNGDNGIVDRWHNPGWQNTVRKPDGSKVALWYTPESDRSITYVDIYVYWDQNIGGNPKPFIDAEISQANEIFRRSGVYIRLNLVGYEVIDLPVESANETIRDMDYQMGSFSNIQSVWEQTGADMVHTFASQDTRRKMCGVGFMGGYKGRWDYRDNVGVTVCHGGETFVHEIAHNFGSDHDNSNAIDGFHFWYSLGFNRRNQAGFDEVSTVMSYGNAEVGVFSSPDLICKGEPCGVVEQADNVKSLNHVRNWVAKANGPESGNSVGTYVEPDTSDRDNDGVTDYYDTCPNTPYGAVVDTFGCEIDNNTNTSGGSDGSSTSGSGSSSNGSDRDSDGVSDNTDNCPNDYNPNQADNDGDGIGNSCDSTPDGNTYTPPDADGDGVSDGSDNCPNNYNPNQADNDNDGKGNICDSTPNGTVTTPPPSLAGDYDVSSHGGICTRSRSAQHDYVVNFRGFQNNSNSGSVWALCPLSRGSGSSMIAAEITILPVTDAASTYNVRCDLVEIYEGNVKETISLTVNPSNTNLGQSTHVFDPVSVTDVNTSSFAIECQIPRGYAITGIRQVSGN